MSTVFRYIKVAFHGIIFSNDLPGLGKCAFCSMAFLTMTIKYLLEFFREIYKTLHGTFLGEVFYNNSEACFMGHFKGVQQLFQKILKVCSGTFLEQTKVYLEQF